MYSFSNSNIQQAVAADLPAIEALMNLAYRGEVASRTWTSEAHLIAGDTRTNGAELKRILKQPGSIFLKYCRDEQTIEGCVNVQQHDDNIYMGMLSVSPYKQGSGIGKQLLHAVDEFAMLKNAVAIYITIISVRFELIDWYKRHGYVDTGERKKYVEDDVSGKHLQPLEFMVMQKMISKK